MPLGDAVHVAQTFPAKKSFCRFIDFLFEIQFERLLSSS